jgi:hypothetical protein
VVTSPPTPADDEADTSGGNIEPAGGQPSVSGDESQGLEVDGDSA